MKELLAVLMALLLAACGSSESPSLNKSSATPTQGADGVDDSTKAASQKVIDAALDRLVDAPSGRFATYVNFEGSAIKVVGSFDLRDNELESLTTFPGASPEDGGDFAIRGRVIGSELYGNPSSGPLKRCWFHYTEDSLSEILPGDAPFDSDYAAYPAALVMVLDATAHGFLGASTFDVSADVPAQAALAAFSAKFAASAYEEIADEDVVTRATIKVQNGSYAAISVKASDLVDAYDDAGIDLFKGQGDGAERVFRTARLRASFSDYGTDVSVTAPSPQDVLEVAGVDDIDPSASTCAAAAA